MELMVEVKNVKHSYKDREALKGVSFNVRKSEIFGLLGPNGSGKTTLFKILSTALPISVGEVKIIGMNLAKDQSAIREKIGVVFQSPSLDLKLSVRENLIHQGHLYGLCGGELNRRIDEMLSRLGLQDRAKDMTGKLSGGLKRRVELAKGLLHGPKLVILDEPSTGLDPGARLDLWKYLKTLRDQEGATILVTTHLMDEAEHCDRVAIVDQGLLLRLGTPDELKRELGGDVLLIKAKEDNLKDKIRQRFNLDAVLADGLIQIESQKAAQFLPQLVEAFPGEIESVTFRKPTLEDVFVHFTGHRFWAEEAEPQPVRKH